MLKSLEINGFKSFGNKSELDFNAPISAIVGPNGSGKSNAAEAFRFVLGEQSLKALRARHSDELLYNGGQEGRRRNRASVKAVFDNSNNLLDIDYSEVVIERIIQRGDASTYRINGSQVRLKDVIDLLSDANIGTSRHHIISQGEADRILNVHQRERKSIIEDALGLRRFYRRRREAIKKLDKTDSNLEQAETRQQDLKPELKYLKRQKKRIEKTKELRDELTCKYQKFFKREAVFLKKRGSLLRANKKELQEKQAELKEEISTVEKTVASLQSTKDGKVEEADSKEKIDAKLQATETELTETTKKLGQVSGQLQALQKQQNQTANKESCITISMDVFHHHRETFESLLERADTVDDVDSKGKLLSEMCKSVSNFLQEVGGDEKLDIDIDNSNEIAKLKEEEEELEEKHQKLKNRQQKLREEKTELEENERQQENEQHEAEKRLVELTSKEENVSAELNRINEQIATFEQEQEQIEDEKSEARILCGKKALQTEAVPLVNADGEEVSKEELLAVSNTRSNREYRRQLERLKIKLENTRVSDQKEVLDEYERVQSQMDFLEKEIADLKDSKDSLLELIDDIETTVAEKFDHGITAINKAFSEFFSTMFGGGDAELFITEHPKGKNMRVEEMEEKPEETERGVGISVKLPNKKVRGLGVLSGGERSLVSIALLFALSQINPPPFIVLDEADAALDEANSRRFGDMIDELSDRSQLIIITHNRETMHRADVLYGVTMDQHGGSRLLSLNFSEAEDALTK